MTVSRRTPKVNLRCWEEFRFRHGPMEFRGFTDFGTLEYVLWFRALSDHLAVAVSKDMRLDKRRP